MITIATLGGNAVTIQVDNLPEGANISSVKRVLETETGVSMHNLKLYFEGEELEDTVSIGKFMEGREASFLSMIVVGQYWWLCQKHKPVKSRQDQLKCWLFKAASQGCQECVQILVKDMGVDKNATSDNHGYTAMDFAQFEQQVAMMAFLETL